jgi:hypothetical protein
LPTALDTAAVDDDARAVLDTQLAIIDPVPLSAIDVPPVADAVFIPGVVTAVVVPPVVAVVDVPAAVVISVDSSVRASAPADEQSDAMGVNEAQNDEANVPAAVTADDASDPPPSPAHDVRARRMLVIKAKSKKQGACVVPILLFTTSVHTVEERAFAPEDYDDHMNVRPNDLQMNEGFGNAERCLPDIFVDPVERRSLFRLDRIAFFR